MQIRRNPHENTTFEAQVVFSDTARGAVPLPPTPTWASPGSSKIHSNRTCKSTCAPVRPKGRSRGAQGVPGHPHVRQRSPKWNQNGGPGPSRDGPEWAPHTKRRDMRSVHYLLCFTLKISKKPDPQYFRKYLLRFTLGIPPKKLNFGDISTRSEVKSWKSLILGRQALGLRRNVHLRPSACPLGKPIFPDFRLRPRACRDDLARYSTGDTAKPYVSLGNPRISMQRNSDRNT